MAKHACKYPQLLNTQSSHFCLTYDENKFEHQTLVYRYVTHRTTLNLCSVLAAIMEDTETHPVHNDISYCSTLCGYRNQHDVIDDV